MIFERLMIVVALAAVTALVFWVGRIATQRRLATLKSERLFDALVPQGTPAVVAFTLPGCADCRARQAPALQRLSARIGAQARVITLRADEHADLVDRLGVMTVPATAVVSADGQVQALNQGFADDRQLALQLGIAA